MDTLYTLATSTYASTTGFSVQNMIGYATSSVLKLFVGGTLSVLDMGRAWIIAGLVIGAFIDFAARALYFFRH